MAGEGSQRGFPSKAASIFNLGEPGLRRLAHMRPLLRQGFLKPAFIRS